MKRRKRANKKSELLKRLKMLESKEYLTQEEENEVEKILKLLDKKSKNRIDSIKLNNNKQNEPISISINITNDINTGESTKDLDWSTPDHFKSASGQYRKARIDNRKY